ncbi:SRPBCC domain-containing protein [Mariniflexile litorale]|uniref:SRPBCC domain-containing protein n=1 Tax=Mariniflexile litorale TaxID=3045158 RepID=A0AAU7EGB0_9FLAO|nr:SRPBCC domain-containing protein [Mariniflexile sp. KMM 9835]MDQ8212023.1 SRPBCC domain-containing protein [Mariniflexile sp. KMM 9835]
MKHYTYSFSTPKSSNEVFNLLLDVTKWWIGFYEETITGTSQKIGDEFSFHAGGGMHITKQKLVELIPDKKIVWLVTESNLSFLNETDEWNNTKLIFDIQQNSDAETKVQFTHEGLAPQIECYDQCSSAWNQYLEKLEGTLKKIS